jgi:hypothetical protein
MILKTESTFHFLKYQRSTKFRRMKTSTITIDQKWVDELIKRLDKYDMFKDRSQKIYEWVQTTSETEKSLKKGKVTQEMVEQWCRKHKVKLVQKKYLSKGIADCPALWIRPTINDEEICTAHKQCSKCGICLDPSETTWKSRKTQKLYCDNCSCNQKINRVLCNVPEIDRFRPCFDKN